MAPMIFAKSILCGKPIQVFNYGDMERDFTYIDDIVEALYPVVISQRYLMMILMQLTQARQLLMLLIESLILLNFLILLIL